MVMVILPRYSLAAVMGRLEKPVVVAHEEDLRIVAEGVLEGEYRVVAGLLR